MKTRNIMIIITAMAMIVAPFAQAADLYWSANGLILGGAGTWNTSSSTNWGSTATGPFAMTWVNANNDSARFSGTANTVTLGATIDVGGLTFDTTAYTLANSSYTLNFAATDNLIAFNNATAAATITGTVGGSGNVILYNVAPTTAGTLTFNGTSTGGWSGATTINAGMTLATVSTAALTNKVMSSTTGGITLNGGTIQFTRASNANIDAINASAISVNGGGTFSVTSGSGGAGAIENIGTVTVNSGQMNFVQTVNNQNTLTLAGLAGLSTGSSNAVTFSATSSAFTTAAVAVSGASATGSNEIIGPWATVGSAANAQTDYAIYNGASQIVALNTAASAESTWATAWAATANHTVTIATGTSTNLTATRKINSLRKIGGAAQATTTVSGNIITIPGSAFQNNDVVATANNQNLTGTTRETAYYVVNASGTSFQLAATPGGTPLAVSGSASFIGGINLGNNNLETYGILSGSAQPLPIGASGTGAVTTPSGGGKLHLTAGSGHIIIAAPITDNGGAVTVVRNGTGGNVMLSGNNSFTGGLIVNAGGGGTALRLMGAQSFTGGITLNGGGIGENASNSSPYTQAASLNGNAITVNGLSHLVVEGTLSSSSTITINPNVVLKLGAGNSTLTVPGVVSGSGVLDVNANNFNSVYSVSLTHSANIFSGDVIYTEGNGTRTLNVNSIGDSGKVIFGLGTSSQTFALNSTAASPLTFNTRRFEMAGTGGTAKIGNSSAQAFTINTDLLATGTGARTLTLQGTGTGLSTFVGDIGNGSLTSLGITKAESGTWALSGTNTYSGITTIQGGTLSVGTLANAGVSSGLGSYASAGANGLVLSTSAGTLKYTGNTVSIDRGLSVSGAFVMTVDVATANQTLTLGNCSITAAGTLQADSTGGGSTLVLGTVTLTAAGTLTANTANLTVSTVTGTNLGLTLSGSGAGTGTVGAITTGTGTLAKSGAGTWTLSGANGYTGATTVSGGRLLVNGSTHASSAVSVTAGTLGGIGTVGGTVTAAAGGGINLCDATVGTLTLSSTLTLNGTSGSPNPLYFDMNGTGVDMISVAGNVTAGTASNVVVYLNQLTGTTIPNATYDLLTSANTLTLSSFVLGTANAGGKSYTLQLDPVTSKKLQLVVASGATGPVAAFWKGGGNNWSTAANWNTDATSGTALTIAPGYQANVSFYTTSPTAGNLTSDVLDTDFNINSLTFTTAATSPVTIGGTTKMLTIEAAAVNGNTAGNGITLNNTSGTHTISAKIGLATNQTWTVAAGGTLQVEGGISDFSGNYGITKSGSGRLILKSNANAYSGNTVVNGGALRFGIDYNGTWTTGVLPARSNLEINEGIVEAWYAKTFTLGTGAGQIQLTGGRSGFSNLQSDASGHWLIFTTTGTTVTWGTSIFQPSTLVLNDTGALCVLRMPNPFDLNGAARTIEVSATGSGSGSRGTYGCMEGNLSGSGASLIKTGVGTLMLNGANTYTGGTTINNGGLWFNQRASMPNSGSVTVNDSTILSISVGNTGGWTTGTSGNGTIGGLLSGLGGQAGGTVSYSGNVFLGFNLGTAGSSNQTYPGDIANVGTTLGIHVGNKDGGTANDPFPSYGFIFTLTGNNSYTGGTTLNRGTLAVGHANALSTGTITLNGGTTIQSSDTTARTLPNALVLGGDITIGGTGNLTFSNTGAVALGANRSITVTTSGVNATFAQAFSGGFAITKAGAGTLTLTGTNTYTGTTTVNAGSLVVSGGGITNNAAVTVNAATMVITNGANVFSGGAGSTIGTSGSGNAMLIVGGSGVTSLWNLGNQYLTVGYNNGSGPISFVIDGAGVAGSAIVTNVNQLRIGNTWTSATGANNNSLSLTNGASLFSVGAITVGYADGQNSNVATNNSITIMGGAANSILNAGAGNLIVGQSGYGNNVNNGAALNNRVLIGTGGVLTNASSVIVGYGTRTQGPSTYYLRARNSLLTVDGGGKLYSAGTSYIGYNTDSISSANTNAMAITGTNSLWNLGGATLFIGRASAGAATGNSLTVSAGAMATNISALIVSAANTLSLGVGGQIYAGTVTNSGTLAVRLDKNVTPSSGRLSVTNILNVSNATLDVTVGATPTEPCVIATYKTLIGTFAATNGLSDKFKLEMDYKGQKQIAIVYAASGTMISFK